jgi:predicted peptidase
MMSNRIYLTGLCGGWGAWNFFAHPEMFAALVPIAGFVDRVPMIENCVATIPLRIFHGLVDDVDVNYSIAIYKKLKPLYRYRTDHFDDAG